jgi:hypothetical protein
MTTMNKQSRIIPIVLSFIAGAASVVAVPALVSKLADKIILPKDHREIARTTSPDGSVDAVTEDIECGAPCAATYEVSVVPKGAKASADPVRQILIADDATDLRVAWKQPHLLDIAYSRALIDSFRNVAYPFAQMGNRESWGYGVEIRLTPLTSGFSYLHYGETVVSP